MASAQATENGKDTDQNCKEKTEDSKTLFPSNLGVKKRSIQSLPFVRKSLNPTSSQVKKPLIPQQWNLYLAEATQEDQKMNLPVFDSESPVSSEPCTPENPINLCAKKSDDFDVEKPVAKSQIKNPPLNHFTNTPLRCGEDNVMKHLSSVGKICARDDMYLTLSARKKAQMLHQKSSTKRDNITVPSYQDFSLSKEWLNCNSHLSEQNTKSEVKALNAKNKMLNNRDMYDIDKEKVRRNIFLGEKENIGNPVVKKLLALDIKDCLKDLGPRRNHEDIQPLDELEFLKAINKFKTEKLHAVPDVSHLKHVLKEDNILARNSGEQEMNMIQDNFNIKHNVNNKDCVKNRESKPLSKDNQEMQFSRNKGGSNALGSYENPCIVPTTPSIKPQESAPVQRCSNSVFVEDNNNYKIGRIEAKDPVKYTVSEKSNLNFKQSNDNCMQRIPKVVNQYETSNENDKFILPKLPSGFVRCKSNETYSDLIIKGIRYRVLSLLGKGGSSEVFLVLNTANSQLLAVKCVKLADVDPTVKNDYLNEIQHLLRLQHCDNVIQLLDHEYLEKQKLLFVVMERGDTDLSQLLKARSATGTVTPGMILHFWAEMLVAVKNIHDNNIIHRDLKPANFLLVAGRLKLIDFGIASAIQSEQTSVLKDSTTGTCSYMSPEAIQDFGSGGNTVIKIGRKSDVWSLGCILYSFLYGKTPYQDIKHSILKLKAISNPNHKVHFPKIPGIPDMLIHSAQRCLVHEPAKRASIDELLQAINDFYFNK